MEEVEDQLPPEDSVNCMNNEIRTTAGVEQTNIAMTTYGFFF